jgi:NADP-dependent 3-hydroxy acid dehydrogenase YdfG
MADFSGRVTLITGAAGNLGEATARAFFAAGSRLVLVDNRRDRLDQVYSDVLDRPECLLPSIDITDENAVDKMVAQALAHFNQIDIVANIAGGYRAGTPVHITWATAAEQRRVTPAPSRRSADPYGVRC